MLNVSSCKYCGNNVQMDLYHIVTKCREIIEPIVTKVQLNLLYPVFKFLFYSVTREVVVMVSTFFKAVCLTICTEFYLLM